MKWLFVSLFIAMNNYICNAQSHYIFPHKLEVGLGTASYQGDLCNDLSCVQFDINFNIGIRYHLTNHFSVKPNIGLFRLSAADENGSNKEERKGDTGDGRKSSD